jgi:glycosyltransferase involved in cell wall biosynthesis
MASPSEYTLIIPRADRAGPCNLAVDIGRAAKASGLRVRVLYLSGAIARDDLVGIHEVRRWRWSDLLHLGGVIHTHGLRPDLLGWMLSWGRGRTLVTTLHSHFLLDVGMVHSRWKVLPAWWAWSRALARFDHRVCISHTMRRYYRRMLPGLRFEVAYNFTGPATAAPSEQVTRMRAWIRQQREGGSRCLAYVGALIARKNVIRLLEAVARTPGLSLVICGGGPLENVVAQRIARPDLSSRVCLAGVVRFADQVIAECDMLVLPSLAEGLPLVVLEAARVGRPSLLSNIAVHRELARLGLGTTFDRHRFSDFAEKAQALVRDHGPGGTPDPSLLARWQKHFSAQPGFERYCRLLTGERRGGGPAGDAVDSGPAVPSP